MTCITVKYLTYLCICKGCVGLAYTQLESHEAEDCVAGRIEMNLRWGILGEGFQLGYLVAPALLTALSLPHVVLSDVSLPRMSPRSPCGINA